MKRRNKRKSTLKIKNKKRFIIVTFLIMGMFIGMLQSMKSSACNSKDSVVSLSHVEGKDIKIQNNDKNLKKENKDKKVETSKIKNNLVKDEDKKNKSKVSNKELFKDSLFLGDSITEPLSFYEILNDRNVEAVIGLTIPKAYKMVDKIIDKNPKNLFILLGQNDIANDTYKIINNYLKLIEKLKKNLPSSKIYVQSIMPILPKAENTEKELNMKNITNLNENIKRLAKSENVKYVDLNPMFVDFDKNLYEPDGIHFKANFYGIWLNYLKNIIE